MNGIRARDFLEMIARMTMDGEVVNGETCEMNLEDAAATLDRLIQEARAILENKNALAVIAAGNPIDGITLYGPYFSSEEAHADAESIRDMEWWVAEIKDLNP